MTDSGRHEPVVRTLTTSDDFTLHFRHYHAVGACRGIVVALHGIQSHSGWYGYSSQTMAEAGFDVYYADRRGSGLNGRHRGHADHAMRLLNDVRQLIRLARREHADTVDVPLTLLAVSWGGRLAAGFAATYPDLIDRLALLYPGLETKFRLTRWQRTLLNVARRGDVRHKLLPIPLNDPSLFTNDADWQRYIADDPLALHQLTSGLLMASCDLAEIVQRRPDRIVQPTLLMLAGCDDIINNTATRQRVATFGTRHLTQICYPQARHTLEFDADRERIMNDLVAWLRA